MTTKLPYRTALLVSVTLLSMLFASSKTQLSASANEARSMVTTSNPTETLNFSDFNPAGDGVTDDGPALQQALDALAAGGGGTLLVPAGRYVIATPVSKNFTGMASSVTILGVESSTPLAPPTAPGAELAKGLDLVSEFYPRTGDEENAITIQGLQNFLIKDIAFIGTQGVITDAAVTLELIDIDSAIVRHCEFYGVATFTLTGGVVRAVRSHLKIEQTKFLGCTGASGRYVPVVENVEWLGITVTDTHFVDYGLRPDFYSKTPLAASISWINVGNAAQATNDSPRREVIFRNLFLDEGAYFGLTSLPYRYAPPSAPIDLIYITGLRMNVSNFGTSGHYFYDVRGVMVEKSRYEWSHNADSAVRLLLVGNAILDQLTFLDHTDAIRADSKTERLTVINSNYTHLFSEATTTTVINTPSEEDDPVQYVRREFEAVLGREPDPAGHFYWSDLFIRCGDDIHCRDDNRAALDEYLGANPPPTFSVAGRVTDENGAVLSGATVTLSGSQSLKTTTDVSGDYAFSNLPTSGVYTLATSKAQYTFNTETLITPAGDQVKNFTGIFSPYKIGGRVTTSAGTPVGNLTVSLAGAADVDTTTDNQGNYSFLNLFGGTYTISPSDFNYVFSPPSRTIVNLGADATADFTLVTFSIGGRITRSDGEPLSGVTVTLSGASDATTMTSHTGHYFFKDLPAGWDFTVTPTQSSYQFNPLSRTYNGLDGHRSDDFSGIPAPLLLAEEGSDLAVALHALTLVVGPFKLEDDSLFAPGRRTRLTLFAKNVDLSPADGVVTSAQVEDALGIVYPLDIEFLGPVPELDSLTQIIVRLSRTLPEGGSLWLSIQQGTLRSNKVRIRIALP